MFLIYYSQNIKGKKLEKFINPEPSLIGDALPDF